VQRAQLRQDYFPAGLAAPDVVHDRAAGIEELRPGGRRKWRGGEKQYAGKFLHVYHTRELQSGEQAIAGPTCKIVPNN